MVDLLLKVVPQEADSFEAVIALPHRDRIFREIQW
jgi:hypothetical protein